MITLSSLIHQFEADFLSTYQAGLLPRQMNALQAMKICRTPHSPVMQVNCTGCDHHTFIPHSCGHRNCPHCQHHESQQWIERQVQKQVPAQYFMITFTLPAQLRTLAWLHQRLIYSLMFDCVWDTLHTFSQNDKQLKGNPGVIAVLHTHSRALDYHPHIHAVMPAAIVDKLNRLWRTKKGHYLFNHKALAKVFREKDILSCKDGQVTFRYQDSKTKRWQKKTVSGADFLWRVLQHVLPKGFRRARNFGFLHPNSKQLIQILQYLKQWDPAKLLSASRPRPQMTCECCGAALVVGRTRIPVVEAIVGMRMDSVPT